MLNIKQVKQLAEIGYTVGIGVEQYKYLREHCSLLLSKVRVNKAIVGSEKKLKYLLTPPSQVVYNEVVSVIPGDYHILDGKGALILATAPATAISM